MTPVGAESEFYAFFEITDRGTSWLAPLLFVAIGELTGNIRIGGLASTIMLTIGIVLLVSVDTKRGGVEARNFHVTEQDDEVVDTPETAPVEI